MAPAVVGTSVSPANGDTVALTQTCPLPAGWAVDDVAWLTVTQGGANSTSSTITLPTGWTQVANLTASTNQRTVVAWRRLVAGDTDPVITRSAAGGNLNSGIMLVQGCRTTGAPYDVTPSTAALSATATTITVPGVITTQADTLAVLTVGRTGTSTVTFSGWTLANIGAMTERLDVAASAAFGAATLALPSLADTGNATVNVSTAALMSGVLVALVPPAPAPPPPAPAPAPTVTAPVVVGDQDDTPFNAAAYARLEPVATHDEELGWPLRTFVRALGAMIRPVEDLVRPADPDRDTWAPLLDPDLAPDWNLAWLAQFVGVRLSPGATPDRARVEIRSVGGFRRGTPAAMLEAVRPTLTGNQYVFLQERDGDEAHLTLVTKTSETPNAALTLAAARGQKAAGLILTHVVTNVHLYVETAVAAPTYAARTATYANYAAARGF